MISLRVCWSTIVFRLPGTHGGFVTPGSYVSLLFLRGKMRSPSRKSRSKSSFPVCLQIFIQRFEIAANSILRHFTSLIEWIAFRHTPGQSRHMGDVSAFFSRLE